MKNFEFGTSEYWEDKEEIAFTTRDLVCEGAFSRLLRIASDKTLYDREDLDGFPSLRAVSKAVVEAEKKYEKIKAFASLRNKQMGDPKKDNEQDNTN